MLFWLFLIGQRGGYLLTAYLNLLKEMLFHIKGLQDFPFLRAKGLKIDEKT
jgi:hypothetical protein